MNKKINPLLLTLFLALWICPSMAATESQTIQFETLFYYPQKGEPQAAVTVTRTHGASGEVSVDYSTGQDTALPDQDYQETSGTLVFKEGEVSKTISIPLISTQTVSRGKSFFISLISDPTGNARHGY